MTLSVIHDRLGNAALAYFFIIAVWGYWRFFRKQGLDLSFWGSLAIGELLLLAEALLGAVLWITGERPARGVHLLYGVVALAAIPTAYAYTKGRRGARQKY